MARDLEKIIWAEMKFWFWFRTNIIAGPLFEEVERTEQFVGWNMLPSVEDEFWFSSRGVLCLDYQLSNLTQYFSVNCFSSETPLSVLDSNTFSHGVYKFDGLRSGVGLRR